MQSKHVKNRHNKMKKDRNRNQVATAEQPENTSTELVVIPQNNETEKTFQTVEVVQPEHREKKVMSVKEIMDKHARISKCLEKRESIDEASKTLDSFNFGSSKIKDVLIIKDGRGNTFETSKTDLIEDVISLLKDRVEVKTAEVEAELLQLEAA